MAHRFTRTRAGITVRLDDAERVVLREAFTDVAALLDPTRGAVDPGADPLEALVGITEGAELPDDPALARGLWERSEALLGL